MVLENIVNKVGKFIGGVLLASSLGCGPNIPEFPNYDLGKIKSEKQKGFNYVSWDSRDLNSRDSYESLKYLKKNGVNSISVVISLSQDELNSTKIYEDYPTTIELAEVDKFVKYAHNLGLSVMLKPHVNPKTNESRTKINCENNCKEWFRSYEESISKYLELANRNNVEYFCIGTELDSINTKTEWLDIIKHIREKFNGKLTYAANHDAFNNVTFWEYLDIIGIDAYFPLNGSFFELNGNWNYYFTGIEDISLKYDKPVVFTEFGYASAENSVAVPWGDFRLENSDVLSQYAGYKTFFDVFWDKYKWFDGVYFWYWDTNPNSGGMLNKGFNPKNKPAESLVFSQFKNK